MEAGTKVQIDAAAVAALAGSLTPAVVKSRAVFFRMPMRFDDAKQEVNFLALYHLLDFGSGFDALLRAKSGRDAHEVSGAGRRRLQLEGQQGGAGWRFCISGCWVRLTLGS